MIVACPNSPVPRPDVQHDWLDSRWVSPAAPQDPWAVALWAVAKAT